MEAQEPKPDIELARRVLPAGVFQSLSHIFQQGVKGCALAGGTALAGFYAGHRKSDDLDFFTSTESKQKAAVLAIRSLQSKKFALEIVNETAQYFEAIAKLSDHLLKITGVLDSNLFRAGEIIHLDGNIQVVSLKTLLKMKAATLASRCSEKDLYDLLWLFEHFGKQGIPELISLGNEIDAGVDAEAILSSLGGAILSEKACDFSLEGKITPRKVFQQIQKFRKTLLTALRDHLEDQPVPPLGELVRRLRNMK